MIPMQAIALAFAAAAFPLSGAGPAPNPFSGPLRFESNDGQFPSSVKFLARARRYTVALAAREATLMPRGGGRALHLRFPGANPAARIEGEGRQAAVSNYFIGADRSRWRPQVAAYNGVVVRQIYPGIDLVFHGDGEAGGLEYDFRVAPGADASRIRVAFDAPRRLHIDSEGNLRDGSARGGVVQKRPLVYQETAWGGRENIASKVVPAGRNRIAFQLGAHDPRRAVTIDPTVAATIPLYLGFSTYYGGVAEDGIESVRVDAAGNTYLVGYTKSPDLHALPSGPNNVYRGGYDGFAAKYDASGNLVYLSYLGGAGEDDVLDAAPGAGGDFFVVGETESTDFPIPNANPFQGPSAFPGGIDFGFVASFDSNGVLKASTYLGGQVRVNSCVDTTEAYAVAADASGNPVVTGLTCAADFPVKNGSFNTTFQGTANCFVTKFDAALTQTVYSTFLGGFDRSFCTAVAVDAAGAAYVTGATRSTGMATAGAVQTQLGSSTSFGDAFAAKLSPDGTKLTYFTYLGGADADAGTGIAVDSAGNAHVTGWTVSRNFPTKNALQAMYGGTATAKPQYAFTGGGDVYFAKIDPTGSQLLYSSFFGSAGDDVATAIALGPGGDLLITGHTSSPDLAATAGAAQSKFGGGVDDGFLLVVAADGSAIRHFTYLGGSAGERPFSVAPDGRGGVLVAGYTKSTDFPLANPWQATYAGGFTDGFLARFTPTAPPAGPAVTAVANGASFTTTVSAGMLASAFGTLLAAQPINATTTPLQAMLGTTSIRINGILAPLLYVGPTQINFQIPRDITPGPATAVVQNGSQSSASFNFTVSAAAPGVFVYSTNRAIAQDTSYILIGPDHPAPGGSYITVYLTGQGPVDNPVPDGMKAPGSPLARATLSYSATIGGKDAPVIFLGLVPGFVGFAQANIQVPAGLPAGNYPLAITVGGIASSPALISVK